MKNLRMQQEMTDRGRLEIRVNARIQARPVSGARVTVSYTGDPQNVIEELITEKAEVLDKEAYYDAIVNTIIEIGRAENFICLLYTSPSPRDRG